MYGAGSGHCIGACKLIRKLIARLGCALYCTCTCTAWVKLTVTIVYFGWLGGGGRSPSNHNFGVAIAPLPCCPCMYMYVQIYMHSKKIGGGCYDYLSFIITQYGSTVYIGIAMGGPAL